MVGEARVTAAIQIIVSTIVCPGQNTNYSKEVGNISLYITTKMIIIQASYELTAIETEPNKRTEIEG